MAGDQSAKTTTTRTGSTTTTTTRALAGVISMSSASASASAAALCLCWALLSTAAVGGAAGSGDVSASGNREPAFVQLAAVPDAFQSRSSFNGAKFVVSPVVAVGSKGANKVRVKRAGNGEFFHKKRLQRLKSKMRRQKFRLMETRLRNFPLSSSSSSSSSSGKKGKRFKHGSSSSSSSGGAAYSYPHQPAYYHHHQPAAAVYHHQPVYHHRQAGYGHQQLSPAGYQSYGPQYNDYASHYGHAAVATPYHGGSQYGAPVATAGTDYHHQGDYAKQSSSESASKEQVEEASSKDQAET